MERLTNTLHWYYTEKQRNRADVNGPSATIYHPEIIAPGTTCHPELQIVSGSPKIWAESKHLMFQIGATSSVD